MAPPAVVNGPPCHPGLTEEAAGIVFSLHANDVALKCPNVGSIPSTPPPVISASPLHLPFPQSSFRGIATQTQLCIVLGYLGGLLFKPLFLLLRTSRLIPIGQAHRRLSSLECGTQLVSPVPRSSMHKAEGEFGSTPVPQRSLETRNWPSACTVRHTCHPPASRIFAPPRYRAIQSYSSDRSRKHCPRNHFRRRPSLKILHRWKV